LRVCLLPSDTWGVGSYRTLFPGRELEKRGHEVYAHLDKDYLARWNPREGNVPLANALDFEPGGKVSRTFDADSYVFQRRMEQTAGAAIRTLRRQGKHTVYELDDNYDLLPAGSPGQKVLQRHGTRLRLEWMNDAIASSDVVTVSTPALQEHYSQYSDNVVVLPNYLDWEMWRDVPLQCEIERPRLRVGWMGWLEWRGRDLEQLRPWIGAWLRDHPDVDFVSVGERHGNAKYLRKLGYVSVHDYLDVPKAQRVTVKAAPFHDLAKITASMDIGLVPLEASGFNECKSHLKGLEYGACGIPCIASPSEPYKGFVNEGVNGYLARTQRDWVTALDTLVNDDDYRRLMGLSARTIASERTIQREWKQWEKVWSPASTSDQAQTTSPAGSTLITA
jgi:O-antigen biosynthesis protein